MKMNYQKGFKAVCIIIAVMATHLVTGCTNSNTQASTVENMPAKSVIAIAADSEAYVSFLEYKGYVVPKEEKSLSFGLSGKVKEVYVERGQQIKAGELIAEMDTASIEMSIDSANQDISIAQNAIKQLQSSVNKNNSSVESGKLNLDSLQNSIEVEEINLQKEKDSYETSISSFQMNYDNAKDTYEKTKMLHEAGAVSLQELERTENAYTAASLELNSTLKKRDNDIALQQKNIESMRNKIKQQEISNKDLENDISSTQSQIELANIKVRQAEIGLDKYRQQFNETAMTSPIDGYVTDVLVQSGENTSFGAPVVKVQSEGKIINIGVPIDDYRHIQTGMAVNLEAQEIEFSGRVSMIALSPDESSRTYAVEITPDTDDLAIGTLVEVYIPIENRENIFVPFRAVMTMDGTNYVYVLEENESGATYTVWKKEIIVSGNPIGDKVPVDNIEPGTLIVAEGVKEIKETDIVIVAK